MIDSFLVGIAAYYPQSLVKPFVMPWNPAAEENFFRTPILAFLADNWKCIPIKKGRKDVGAIYRMAEALRTSPMILFPEGTRARSGAIGKARGGAGMLILETQPKVVPVYIDGMEKVLPIGAVFPRFFKKIHVHFGEPLDLAKYYGQDKNRQLAQTIMQEVMDAIRALGADLQSRKHGMTEPDAPDMHRQRQAVSCKVRDLSS
jgi:1-acyl-sn-glycerol-3-phosphate acyltransferase